jgi:hypothetical protein
MNLSIRSYFTLALLLSAPALAHDHPPQTIAGDGIELFERNHAFSGSILNTAVFGTFDHKPMGAEVRIRLDETTQVLKFARAEDGSYGTQTNGLSLQLVKAEKTGPTSGLITLNVNGETIAVEVFAPAFENNHFLAPHFKTNIHGRPFFFAYTGEACLGYSTNLAMMILGAVAQIGHHSHPVAGSLN